jgi:hypothetical protein
VKPAVHEMSSGMELARDMAFGRLNTGKYDS